MLTSQHVPCRLAIYLLSLVKQLIKLYEEAHLIIILILCINIIYIRYDFTFVEVLVYPVPKIMGLYDFFPYLVPVKPLI